jgi:hypothetical protein
VRRGARSLLCQEHDRVGDLARVRERGGVDARTATAGVGLDPGVDDQQRDVAADDRTSARPWRRPVRDPGENQGLSRLPSV